jgi:BioD-like phosphotransacetylase family protein
MEVIIYIKNRIYNLIINKTPYKVLFDKKLIINYFKILDFLNYILIFKKIKPNNKINRKFSINYIL